MRKTMNKIILGIDIDGVLYPWHESLYTYYQYEMNYEGTFEQFWLDYIPNLCKEKQDYIVRIPMIYEMATPSESVVNFLDYVSSRADVYYLTHRPEELERITRKYFKRYNFPFQDNLFMTGDKVNACRYLGVTHFIDDFANQVKSVSAVADSYLMAKPWNRDYQEELKTVHNLREFRERIFQ